MNRSSARCKPVDEREPAGRRLTQVYPSSDIVGLAACDGYYEANECLGGDHFMDFHLLSDVRDQDGNTLGELRHLVLDPRPRRIVSLVVQQSDLAGHAVVVPIDAVLSADDDAVYLNFSPEEMRSLQPYAVAYNVAPPPADIDPETQSSDQPQDPIDVPDVAPVGAAQGITSIAYTPIVEVSRNIPEGTIVVDDGTSICATDGELGKLERLISGDTVDEVTALVVESGALFTHPIEVPVNLVVSFEIDRINLRLSQSEIQAANEE
jgi:uncharacterized protein YrrD